MIMSVRIILNGTEVKNVDVLVHTGDYIGYGLRNKSGKKWSLIRNRNKPNLLGVVNHGSINHHKFRGYEWMSDETGDLVGVC